MHRLFARAILVLVVALSLAALVGCGEASAPDDGSSPDTAASDASAPAELPAAPADASGLAAWFTQAYPGATWPARITVIEYVPGEVPGSGGFSNAVVITTDLDYATEQALAQEIVNALGETDLTWAKQYVLWFSDGSSELAGDIVDMTP